MKREFKIDRFDEPDDKRRLIDKTISPIYLNEIETFVIFLSRINSHDKHRKKEYFHDYFTNNGEERNNL